MEDVNFRLEFHRAIDAVAPPAPWLAATVRRALRDRYGDTPARRRSALQLGWLLPLVAVVLAVAIVAGLILATRALHHQTIPLHPPTVQGPGGSACPGWGPVTGLSPAQPPIKMMTPTVGWAAGALRSDDGGVHWANMTPPSFVSDAPSLPGELSVEPPGYAEFFLDRNHAWIDRTYGSATACVDRIQVLSTSDGGQTWVKAGAITLRGLAAQATVRTQLDFVDDSHGWLIQDGGPTGRFLSIYSTSNGGRDWHLISSDPAVCPQIVFSSAEKGWSTCTGQGAALGEASLLATFDGGRSWSNELLPSPPGGCPCSVGLPGFGDSDHGILTVLGNTEYAVLTTVDGGLTWQLARHAPPGWFPVIGTTGSSHFWLVLSPPNSGKGANPSLFRSSDGGATWSVVGGPIPVIGGNVEAIEFVDADHGYVIQSGVPGAAMLVTSDGGRSWTAVETSLQ